MDISLDPIEYAAFLEEFRAADKAANAGDEMVATYNDGFSTAQYFYEAPNFKCVAYSVRGGARVNLTTYNHVSGVLACDYAAFAVALTTGGGGGNRMDANLSKVVALTSEAARSKVVERNIIKALNYGDAFKFQEHELLFKNYGHTTEHVEYRDGGGAYMDSWRPLMKHDYARFFADSVKRDGSQNKKILKLIAL